MRALRCVFLCFFVLSCRGGVSPTDGPVKCEKDSDCASPPCGPCASGSTITSADMQKECVVNACTASGGPAPVAFCSNHVCTIR